MLGVTRRDRKTKEWFKMRTGIEDILKGELGC